MVRCYVGPRSDHGGKLTARLRRASLGRVLEAGCAQQQVAPEGVWYGVPKGRKFGKRANSKAVITNSAPQPCRRVPGAADPLAVPHISLQRY